MSNHAFFYGKSLLPAIVSTCIKKTVYKNEERCRMAGINKLQQPANSNILRYPLPACYISPPKKTNTPFEKKYWHPLPIAVALPYN
jgi:hypothetical protein